MTFSSDLKLSSLKFGDMVSQICWKVEVLGEFLSVYLNKIPPEWKVSQQWWFSVSVSPSLSLWALCGEGPPHEEVEGGSKWCWLTCRRPLISSSAWARLLCSDGSFLTWGCGILLTKYHCDLKGPYLSLLVDLEGAWRKVPRMNFS